MVLFAGVLQDVLGSDEQVRNESRKPVGRRDDEVASVLLVHGLRDLWKFGLDGGVVEDVPV